MERRIVKKIFLFLNVFLLSTFAIVDELENNLKVFYRVVQATELQDSFLKNNNDVPINKDDLYVVGYLSQDIPFKYNITCEIY